MKTGPCLFKNWTKPKI